MGCDFGSGPSGSDCLDLARALSERTANGHSLGGIRSDSDGGGGEGAELYSSGLIVMQKGRRDVISDGRLVVLGPKPVEDGAVGLKRCGGQGDVLAGSLAVTLAWSVAKSRRGTRSASPLEEGGRKQSIGLGLVAPEPILPWSLVACIAASTITRLSVAAACKEAGEGGE